MNRSKPEPNRLSGYCLTAATSPAVGVRCSSYAAGADEQIHRPDAKLFQYHYIAAENVVNKPLRLNL